MITLGELSALAHALVAADREVEAVEEKLKQSKEVARQLREESIPMAMAELGLNEVRLDSGERVTVKQDVRIFSASDKCNEAYAWLEENGFGGLIKTEVVLHFTRGELEAAKLLAEKLKQEGYETDLDRSVHYQTMRAFLREQLFEKANASLPLELFGATPVWLAKVVSPK